MSEKFRIKKQRILSALSRAGDDYTDASPKGSIDEGVRDLIALINDTQNFMTTSSCAGRIAVYLDGPSRLAVSRAPRENQDGPISVPLKNDPSLSTGGKGGGRWLFTSHSPVNFGILASSGQLFREFGFSSQSEVSCPSAEASPQFVHFKFEPMILHIVAASAEDAQAALKAALQAGFRESGASGFFDSKGRPSTPVVAVRSSGLSLDSVIGYMDPKAVGLEAGVLHPMVSESYLRTIVQLANRRFATNEERKCRFKESFSLLKPIGTVEGHMTKALKKQQKREKDTDRKRERVHIGGALDGVESEAETQHVDDEADYCLTMLMNSENEQVDMNGTESTL